MKIKNTTFNFYRASPAAMSVVAMALPLASLSPLLETKWEWETLGGNWSRSLCNQFWGDILLLRSLGATRLMDGKVILPQVRH